MEKVETAVAEAPEKSKNNPRRVLSFGELLWDLLPSGPVLGGAPFNLAFRLSSLGHPAGMASRVGVDSLGEKALARVDALGLETGLIQRDKTHPTGTAPVSLRAGRGTGFHDCSRGGL